jgi:hypothetical protein
VTIDGRSVYLRRHGSPDSHRRYKEAVERWERRQDGTSRPDLSVDELAILYDEFAKGTSERGPDHERALVHQDGPAVHGQGLQEQARLGPLRVRLGTGRGFDFSRVPTLVTQVASRIDFPISTGRALFSGRPEFRFDHAGSQKSRRWSIHLTQALELGRVQNAAGLTCESIHVPRLKLRHA